MNTSKLSLGGCRFDELIARGECHLGVGVTPNFGGVLPSQGAIYLVRGNCVSLCRQEPQKPILRPRTIRFQDGVRVVPRQKDKEGSKGIETLIDMIRTTTQQQLKMELTSLYIEAKSKENYNQETSALDDLHSSFCCFSKGSPTTPLLSITLRHESRKSPSHLSSARFKRNLMGLYVAFRYGEFTSEIRDNDGEIYIVESVTARTSTAKVRRRAVMWNCVTADARRCRLLED